MQRPLKINWSASFRPHKGLFVSLTSASASNKLKLTWIFLIKWMDSRPDFFSKREVFGLDWSLGCLICSENLEEKEKSFNNYFGSFLPHAHTLVHIHAPPHTHTHTRTHTYTHIRTLKRTCSLSLSISYSFSHEIFSLNVGHKSWSPSSSARNLSCLSVQSKLKDSTDVYGKLEH